MPRPLPRAHPRRALIESTTVPRGRRWVERGIATLAVSTLGLGVAASIALTGNAQHTLTAVPTTSASPSVSVSLAPGVSVPDDFDRTERPDRSAQRPALTAGVAQVQAREKLLAGKASSISKRASALAAKKAAEDKRKAAAEEKRRKAEGTPTLPVASYTVAARFGDVGSWARYHTGFDFSAPIGTPIHAPTAGVVTNAGSGSASGWAGTYVTIKHPDGYTTLYAHMSSVSVTVGETVTGGQVIGHIGMTGRSFGPHLHFEVYRAGVEPGDVYSAVNPEPWLATLGLHP